MIETVINTIIQLVVIVGAYCVGRYILPNIPGETVASIQSKIEIMTKYADSFVAWAKQFMPEASGADKMDAVVNQLEEAAKKYGINMNIKELQAIAQAAYNSMKQGLAEVEATETVTEEKK